MSDALILVGRVAGAFGIKGEVRITSFTADPMALIDYKILLREDGSPALTLLAGRVAKGGVVVRTKEIETREQAEAARGLRLYIPRDQLPETKDEDNLGRRLSNLTSDTSPRVARLRVHECSQLDDDEY